MFILVEFSEQTTPCPYFVFSYGSVLEKSLREIWADIQSLKAFKKKTKTCMMIDREFRKQVEKIPKDATLPYRYQKM